MRAQRRRIFQLLKLTRLIIIMTIIIGCGGGGGGSDNGDSTTPSSVTSEYIVYTNSTDGRFFRKIDPDGTSITYYGTKDADGNPLSLNLITVQDPAITGEFVYEIDEYGVLWKISTPEGVVYEIDQLSDTSISLKTTSELGELQFINSLSLESNDETDLSMSSSLRTSPGHLAPTQNARSALNTFNIELTKCGQPVEDAIISMTINPSIGDYIPYANKIGNGRFSISTPAPVDMLSAEEEFGACEDIGKKIDEFMQSFQWKVLIKPLLTSTKTCEQLNKTYENIKKIIPSDYTSIGETLINNCTPALVSNINKISNLPKLGADITKLCKDEIAINHLEVLTQTYTYNFQIVLPGDPPYYPDPEEFNPSNPLDVSIEMPPEISCERIYTDPADPKVDEGYWAIASMRCPDPVDGTEVTISWENPNTGDPGDYNTEMLYTDEDIEISIPAASGVDSSDQIVTDIITVQAENNSWSYPENKRFVDLTKTAASTKKWIMIIQRETEEELDVGLPDFPAYYTGTSTFTDSTGSASGLMRFSAYESGGVTLSYRGEDVSWYQNVYGTHENGSFTIEFNPAFSVSGTFDEYSVSCSGSNEYASASFSGTRVDFDDWFGY